MIAVCPMVEIVRKRELLKVMYYEIYSFEILPRLRYGSRDSLYDCSSSKQS